MDKDNLKKRVNQPGMIPLIHNYCDRWCERCPFTSRCSVFAMEEENPTPSGAKDIDNQAFWNRICENLLDAFDMVREMARENGVDVDAPISEEEEERSEAARRNAKNNELVKSAEKYMDLVENWFDSAVDMFREKQEELEMKARIELPGSDPEAEAVDLNDIIEIIEWYHTLIPPKIYRAVFQEPLVLPDDEYFQSDADGSAKVALISIDRSIAAWMRMREHLPEKQDEILDILIQLDRLRKSLEKAFPKARAFKRPGFDD
ncbi:hypothetical protein JW926_00915 [Candidatus Sumerlaeota bacterium]|nr:hypothetical protein [Candidatus Sumerlaeota bacterium]